MSDEKKEKETVKLEPTTLVRLESIDGAHVVHARSTDSARAALNDHYAWVREKLERGEA